MLVGKWRNNMLNRGYIYSVAWIMLLMTFLLVDVEQLPDIDEPIPRDAHYIHFDGGEIETLLELPSGRHTLQLLLGEEEHEPHDPPLVSDKINVIVQ